MKNRFKLPQIGILILILSVLSSIAWGAKMDLETHDVVINRLESIVKNLDNSDFSKVPSSLRLGDLYAERARLKSLEEVRQNCNNCLKAKEDRLEAIKLYAYVIPKLDNNTRGYVMLQKAHLHYALGHTKSAKKLYQQIIREGRKRHQYEILGQAHALLGDVYFQSNQFKAAKKEYDKALAIHATPQRGLVYYRLSWCLFNLNYVTKATKTLEMILQTPKLTQMKDADGVSQDKSFKIDVSKDLATFYARSRINKTTITRLQSLSPESHKLQNLFFLATEADRLGKKREAAQVWMIYLDSSGQDKETLEAQIHLMRLRRDLGDERAAINTFKNIQELWKSPGCEKKCDELQAKIRKWIIDWNLEKKKSLTPYLTAAYITYTEIFPRDEEMYMRGANVAQQLKNYKQAYELYHKAADMAYYNLKKQDNLSKAKKKEMQQTLHASLLAQIDMAETLKNHDLRVVAYKHYLTLLPKGKEEFEIRYQLAEVEFEKKNYPVAANAYRVLALEDREDKPTLQKTAADMSLDALVKVKNEQAIEAWTLDYSKKFPKHKKEYIITHRKAVLNLTAARINNKTANSNDLEKLKKVPLLGATEQERITIYKNRYLLSVQLKNFEEAKKANRKILYAKGLSDKDAQEAIQNRIWLAELELDFRTAYKLAAKQPGKMTSSRAYKLIWAAQLGGANPSKHEEDFLRLSNNRAQRATVIKNKVQRQVHQTKALKPHLRELSKSPQILSLLALEIYGKSNNEQVLEDVYKYRSVRNSANGPVIRRLLTYNDIDKTIKNLSRANLNSRSDSLLTKTLTKRVNLLTELENHGQDAIKNKDIVLQAIILENLKTENKRLYKDIMSLPAPKGLKKQELQQYQTLLAQQAAPYKVKADQIADKTDDLWSDRSWRKELVSNYKQARFEYKPALQQDLQHLAQHAPKRYRSTFARALKDKGRIPSENMAKKIRNEIRKSPFKTAPVVALKDLENKRGNDVVVGHLESRLDQMKGAVK